MNIKQFSPSILSPTLFQTTAFPTTKYSQYILALANREEKYFPCSLLLCVHGFMNFIGNCMVKLLECDKKEVLGLKTPILVPNVKFMASKNSKEGNINMN